MCVCVRLYNLLLFNSAMTHIHMCIFMPYCLILNDSCYTLLAFLCIYSYSQQFEQIKNSTHDETEEYGDKGVSNHRVDDKSADSHSDLYPGQDEGRFARVV